MTFKPYEDESTSLSLAGLTIENHTNVVSFFGMLQITCDQAGLEAAQKLKSVVDQIVQTLQKHPALPQQIAKADAPVEVKNPFA